MTLIPQRTVASQVAERIRTDILRETWKHWLPSERVLSQTLQAGRNTIRKAFSQLQSEGLIAANHGVGYKIIRRARAVTARKMIRTVAILIPDQLAGLRPFVVLWINELKDLLIENHRRLVVYESKILSRDKPGRMMDRLLKQDAPDVWILALSSHATQSWFATRGLPCVLAGSCYADISLPSLDLDYRAVCRHAAGMLLRHGHRRLALIGLETQHAGDIESEHGFLEGVRGFQQYEASAEIIRVQNDSTSIGRAIRRLLDRDEPVTGLVVCNSYSYLTISSLLAQRGLRIPHDVSLISRDDDHFLQYIEPSPARYIASPHIFAMKMLGAILKVSSQGQNAQKAEVRVLPKLMRGGSIATPSIR